MKKNYPGGGQDAFSKQMECGLVLSSVSPWEMVQNKKGVTPAVFSRARWVALDSCRSPPATWFSNSPWMSPQTALTTGGSRTESSYKRMEPTAPFKDVSTAFGSVSPMALASAMPSGMWCWRTRRRLALRVSTTLRTSTFRAERPILGDVLVLHFFTTRPDLAFCGWGTWVSLKPLVCGNPRAGVMDLPGADPVFKGKEGECLHCCLTFSQT